VKPGVVVAPQRTVVVVETAANIAVGQSPWGPAALTRLREGDPLPAVSGQLVLVGKNNHRHTWVRELADRARVAHPGAVVIDMGWPDLDQNYSDVATFGASRHVSEALSVWLQGGTS
jgi:beta-N-acetylhexosaminidase